MLLRLLVARLGTRDDAEDALQDLWLKIDQLPPQPIAQPAAFLYRMAANHATDRRIAAARRGARDGAWLEVQDTPPDFADPETALAVADERRALERIIASMPERMATALRMFRLEEQPQRAIADHLGISVSGVEKLLQRAYKKIHEELAGSGEDLHGARRQGIERGSKNVS
jgi:RNA polymerase sigma factor (sigma-70 family)